VYVAGRCLSKGTAVEDGKDARARRGVAALGYYDGCVLSQDQHEREVVLLLDTEVRTTRGGDDLVRRQSVEVRTGRRQQEGGEDWYCSISAPPASPLKLNVSRLSVELGTGFSPVTLRRLIELLEDL